jgi:hypothetical protein
VVLLCGRENRFLTLWEEHRARLYEREITEENIWIEEKGTDRKLEKIIYEELVICALHQHC